MRGELERPKTLGSSLMETLFFLGVILVWFALQMWILPSMGVPT
jgi:hypothetical protein